MMMEHDVFLVDPKNRHFLTGERPRPVGEGLGLSVAVAVLVLGGIAVVGISAWQDNDDQGGLLFVSVLVVVLGIAVARYVAHRTALQGRGVVIEGAITDVRGYREAAELNSHYILSVQYQAVSPQTGSTLTGRKDAARSDLNDAALPPKGTRVAVLYLDDETHRLL
jgi:hypothetical protein